VISAQRARGLDGAVLGPAAFLLRYFGEDHGDRLLIVNLGRDLHLDPAPEPLLAPPADMEWNLEFSSEHPRYGGSGTAPVDSDENWRIPGESALLLSPVPRRNEKDRNA
jgi:maltooligosyltrehalose trehalohydrolase